MLTVLVAKNLERLGFVWLAEDKVVVLAMVSIEFAVR